MLQLSFNQQELITIFSNTKRRIDKTEPDDSVYQAYLTGCNLIQLDDQCN